MGASSGSSPDRRIERTASAPRRRALRRAFLQSRSALESTRLRQPRTVPGLLRLAPVSVRFRDAALETLSPFRNRSRRLRHRRGERENRQEPDEGAIEDFCDSYLESVAAKRSGVRDRLGARFVNERRDKTSDRAALGRKIEVTPFPSAPRLPRSPTFRARRRI